MSDGIRDQLLHRSRRADLGCHRGGSGEQPISEANCLGLEATTTTSLNRYLPVDTNTVEEGTATEWTEFV